MSDKDNKYWISAGKFTLIERVSMLIFGVFTFYFIVRLVDKIDYGTWMLFISIHAFLDTARSGFFKNPLVRFLNQEQNNHEGLKASSLQLNLLYSLLSALILLLAAKPIADAWDAPGLVPLMLINIPLSFALSFFSHCEYIQSARFNFSVPMVGNFTRSSLFFCFVGYYFISKSSLDITLLGWGYLASTAVATLVVFWLSRSHIQFKASFNFGWISKLFGYGKYTLGTNLSAVIMRNVDTWMLGWYISPAAVAVYNVAIRIANLFEVPTMALASVLFPQAVQKAEKEGAGALKGLYEKSVSMLFVMLLPMVIGVVLFSDFIVELIAGSEYAEAGFILNITMFYGLIIPFNKQLGILLDAVGKAKTNMLFVARNAIINVVLNAVFIPIWGVAGAAYATLFTMVIVLFINQWYLNRNYQVSWVDIAKNMRFYAVELPKRIVTKLKA